MVIKPSPLQTHARGLMFGALSVFALSMYFDTPTPALIGLAITASIILIGAVRYPAWRWLIFFIAILVQVIFVRRFEGNHLALVQCLSLQIGIAAALVRIIGIHPINN